MCLYSYTSNGLRGLGVDSYHEISAYRLTHRWVFWENGVVYPRIYSAGLYCNYNHRHHAYWRFDFDIEGASNDIAFEYNTTTPNIGWGPGWHVKSPEISRVKNASSLRSWAVMDKGSGRGYHITPGPNDGLADSFAPRDFWVMRYHAAEDKHGNQGSNYNDDLQAYLSGESTDGQDDVIWYCAHLFHDASEPRLARRRAEPDPVRVLVERQT